MIGYASRTGSSKNLAVLRRLGWRLMVSAEGVWRNEGFQYAIDNGAWTCFTQKKVWDPGRFAALVELLGADADFVTTPDIVMGGLASLRLSESWLPRLPGLRLVAVQNGMEPGDVRPLLGATVGIFVGGDAKWKCATMASWGRLARECGTYLHVGRVNSARRIKMCALAGADSFDGTNLTKYAEKNGLKIDRARNQGVLFTEDT